MEAPAAAKPRTQAGLALIQNAVKARQAASAEANKGAEAPGALLVQLKRAGTGRSGSAAKHVFDFKGWEKALPAAPKPTLRSEKTPKRSPAERLRRVSFAPQAADENTPPQPSPAARRRSGAGARRAQAPLFEQAPAEAGRLLAEARAKLAGLTRPGGAAAAAGGYSFALQLRGGGEAASPEPLGWASQPPPAAAVQAARRAAPAPAPLVAYSPSPRAAPPPAARTPPPAPLPLSPTPTPTPGRAAPAEAATQTTPALGPGGVGAAPTPAPSPAPAPPAVQMHDMAVGGTPPPPPPPAPAEEEEEAAYEADGGEEEGWAGGEGGAWPEDADGPLTSPLEPRAEGGWEAAAAAARPRRPAGTPNKRLKAAFRARQSLAGAGLRTDADTGVRRSTRERIRPLEYWRNETKSYGRDGSTRALCTLQTVTLRSPEPHWPAPDGRKRRAAAAAAAAPAPAAAAAAKPARRGAMVLSSDEEEEEAAATAGEESD